MSDRTYNGEGTGEGLERLRSLGASVVSRRGLLAFAAGVSAAAALGVSGCAPSSAASTSAPTGADGASGTEGAAPSTSTEPAPTASTSLAGAEEGLDSLEEVAVAFQAIYQEAASAKLAKGARQAFAEKAIALMPAEAVSNLGSSDTFGTAEDLRDKVADELAYEFDGAEEEFQHCDVAVEIGRGLPSDESWLDSNNTWILADFGADLGLTEQRGLNRTVTFTVREAYDDEPVGKQWKAINNKPTSFTAIQCGGQWYLWPDSQWYLGDSAAEAVQEWDAAGLSS